MNRLDILFLITDGPSKNGLDQTNKYYSLLKKIVNNYLPDKSVLYRFVYPEYVESLTKTLIRTQQQQLFDLIEKIHPKVIMTFGDKAFMALALADARITQIANVPVRSPWFGGVVIDKRSIKAKTLSKLTITDRGMYADKFNIFNLVSHKDIWIYPTYKYGSMMSYGCGYQGQALFERQLTRVKTIIEDDNFKSHEYSYYEQYIKLYKTKADIPEALKILEKLKTWTKYAFDIETAGYDTPKEAQLDFNHTDANIAVIGIGTDKEVYVFNTYKLPELIKPINDVLQGKKIHLTWNGRFDIQFCSHFWKTDFEQNTHIDGMSCLYLTDMSVSHLGKGTSTLKATSSTFLPDGAYYAGYQKQSGIDKAIKEGDGKYLAEHEYEYMLYCGIDVWLTYKVNKLMWNNLSYDARKLVTSYYPNLEESLNDIHKQGITVNEELLDKHIYDLSSFCEDLETSIIMQALIYEKLSKKKSMFMDSDNIFNPKSKQHVCHIMYDIIGLPERLTEKGKQSSDVEVLKEFKNNSFCRMIADYRSFLKQLEIFQAVKKHTHNGKCHPYYKKFKTTSGRLASYDPPIQIIPKNKRISTIVPGLNLKPKQIITHRKIWYDCEVIEHKEEDKCELLESSPYFKEIFTCDTEATFLYADYKQLEIYVLGNFIESFGVQADHTLQNALKSGRDIHSYTASLLYSAITGKEYSYDFVNDNKKRYPYKEWRQDAKSVIFKRIYGGGPKSMAKEKGIPEEDAKIIFDTFSQVIPGIQQYSNIQKILSTTNKFTSTIAGHKRELLIYNYEDYNAKARCIALNHPIQGTASYIVNLCLMEYHKRLKILDKVYGRVLLTIHDSIASQVIKNLVKQAVLLKIWCMEYYIREVCSFIKIPIKIDMEIGTDWHNLKEVNIDNYREYIENNSYKGEVSDNIQSDKLPDISFKERRS